MVAQNQDDRNSFLYRIAESLFIKFLHAIKDDQAKKKIKEDSKTDVTNISTKQAIQASPQALSLPCCNVHMFLFLFLTEQTLASEFCLYSNVSKITFVLFWTVLFRL